MRLALYQPDIPQNLGTLIRVGACLQVPIDVIEPCGFPLGDRNLRRAAMDYAASADVVRHISWDAYQSGGPRGRRVLLTTKATGSFADFQFRADDCLVAGSESRGVPEEVARAIPCRVRIPMAPGLRSLNVAIAAAMVLGEALRQTGHLEALTLAREGTG